ncbi:hypothetical protein PO909_028565 [Leuciscus waleckii]
MTHTHTHSISDLILSSSASKSPSDCSPRIEAPVNPERSDSEVFSQVSSQEPGWHVWSGWWSEEVKGEGVFTEPEHLVPPSETSRSESVARDQENETRWQENVLNEEMQNMEKDEDKQVSLFCCVLGCERLASLLLVLVRVNAKHSLLDCGTDMNGAQFSPVR